jgi:hypothetical protein
MAEGTIISWNPANWVTVVIMVALGFAVLGFGVKLWQQRQGK